MTRLIFNFKDLNDEFIALMQMADRFIDPNSVWTIDQCRSVLQQIRTRPSGTAYSLYIPESTPLVTKRSYGGYEKENQGEHNVVAAISFLWEIEPLGNHSPKFVQNRQFVVDNIASTKIKIYENDLEGRELAMWRMEIADSQSPGCYFHIQLQREELDCHFPKSLSVPRLPAIAVTPAAAIEFVLGEIFQEEWQMYASQDTAVTQLWQRTQVNKIKAVLEWQLKSLKEITGSPWVALKSSQPPENLFSG
jgi:hypothetical protein